MNLSEALRLAIEALMHDQAEQARTVAALQVSETQREAYQAAERKYRELGKAVYILEQLGMLMDGEL